MNSNHNNIAKLTNEIKDLYQMDIDKPEILIDNYNYLVRLCR